MKKLILCIDGLGEKSFNLPGLDRLRARCATLNKHEPSVDTLMSRGWCEFYTGKKGRETGALYQVPANVSGRIVPSQNTGFKYLAEQSQYRFLWDECSRNGETTGVFLVPTVSTKLQNNGFSVAATGGGRFDGKLTPDDVFPSSLFDDLKHLKSDLGMRIGYGAYLPPSLDALDRYVTKHLEDYFEALEICLNRYNVDNLFVGTRFINEMSYKFIGLLDTVNFNDEETKFLPILKKWVSIFDKRLDEFILKQNADSLIIVSDHGIVPALIDWNINSWLEKFLYVNRSKTTVKDYVRPLYYFYKKYILSEKVSLLPIKFDLKNSSFFSIDFTSVIYIRNNSREWCHHSIADEVSILAEKLMTDKDLIENIISRVELLPLPTKIEGLEFLPVIYVHVKNGVLCSGRHAETFYRVNYSLNDMFNLGMYGEVTGCKSDDCVAFSTNPSYPRVEYLTDLYNLVI